MGRGGRLLTLGLFAGLTAAADEPVRVYTNADLENLEPIPTSAPPVDAGPGWEFVIDFLAEQHARIDADRAYELDGALVDETVRRSREAARPRYVLPYNYWYGYGPHHRRPTAAPGPRPGSPRDWVVPLHARRPHR